MPTALVVYMVFAWVVAMPVLWAKGKDEWLFQGLILTAGLAWPVGMFTRAAPDSWWARRSARRAELPARLDER